MIIVHGICKKKVTKKDIAPLTKIMEKSLGAEVYVSVDSTDPHKVKFVMANRKKRAGKRDILYLLY